MTLQPSDVCGPFDRRRALYADRLLYLPRPPLPRVAASCPNCRRDTPRHRAAFCTPGCEDQWRRRWRYPPRVRAYEDDVL